MAERQWSIVYYYPNLEQHRCGYCKQTDTSCSYGMYTDLLTVDDYQRLIDRGWRRSGKYCYKPVMDMTCCPLYTIRCDVNQFKLSNSQKKIIKRVNRYLSTGSVESKTNEDCVMSAEEIVSDITIESVETNVDLEKIAADSLVSNLESDVQSKSSNDVTMNVNKYKAGKGPDPSKPPCKKAKLLRLERKQQKQATNVPAVKKHLQMEKSIEEFLTDISTTPPAHRLKIRLVVTSENGANRCETLEQEYPIYRKYQMSVHDDPPDKCNVKQFIGFLFSSPLKHTVVANGPECGYGSFHQQYWLDEKLIAVGVIDILPKCISSVYFFYDPDFRHFTLGTYGSLREVSFTRELHATAPELRYYYMGYYIHTCPKMRYKANLSPSHLLCPETYEWFPVDKCQTKLNQSKYSRFNDDLDAIDPDACTKPSDIDTLNVLIGFKKRVPYAQYKREMRSRGVNEAAYLQFGHFVGKTCLSRLFVGALETDQNDDEEEEGEDDL